MPTVSHPKRLDDASLILASESEPPLFGAVVEAYAEVILRYLAKRVGLTLAEDLTAETFLVAFSRRGMYRPEHETALPWLYGIATNLMRNHLRSEQRRIEALGRIAARAAIENDQDNTDDAVTAAMTMQQLALGLSALSQDARDVLVLVAIEAMTYAEAAVALQVPVGTVRSRLSRARMDLRQSLAGMADLPRADEHGNPSRRGL